MFLLSFIIFSISLITFYLFKLRKQIFNIEHYHRCVDCGSKPMLIYIIKFAENTYYLVRYLPEHKVDDTNTYCFDCGKRQVTSMQCCYNFLEKVEARKDYLETRQNFTSGHSGWFFNPLEEEQHRKEERERYYL